MRRIIFSEEAKAEHPRHPAAHRHEHPHGDPPPGRFTEEHPDTLRIHTVKNRKDAYL